MKKVLFACVHNAGRSQMAAAWFNELADPMKAFALSAGTCPGSHVHPEVLACMSEVGVDLSTAAPQFLSEELAAQADWLITMGCGEACPVVPGVQRDDWPLEDPKNKPVERVRQIRDEVRDRVAAFVRRHEWARSSQPAARDELEAVLDLLRRSGLPTGGVSTFFPSGYAVVRSDRGVLGVAGLERYGDHGLLRAVAVDTKLRHAGLGQALVRDRVRAATEEGITSVYLLTTTATAYFQKLGFRVQVRASASAALQQSPEFTSLCPEKAVCLAQHIR